MARKIALLGSTGSIGLQALEVIDESPQLELFSIVCHSSTDKLTAQQNRYAPAFAAATGNADEESVLKRAIGEADMVLNAIVGSAGLKASLLAQEMHKPLALANKESLVIGRSLLEKHLREGMIVPVDSEHSTIFRCLQGEEREVRRIMLTASGGSLRETPPDQIYDASPEDVLRHPTWRMGGRITVDSASMVNKAFEVLEARALFPGIPIDVVIQDSSIVHSLIESADGAWKALLGLPDMKVPISWALHYPDLSMPVQANESPLDWGTIRFTEMKKDRYPAFYSVLASGEAGGTAPAAANAADEVAVDAFLRGLLPFGAIATVIEEVVGAVRIEPVEDYRHLQNVDSDSRKLARKVVRRICSR